MVDNNVVVTRLKRLGFHLDNPWETRYKYVDVVTAIKIIKNVNLLYQSPPNFNDPLDPHLALMDTKPFALKHLEKHRATASPEKMAIVESKIDDTADVILREKVKQTGILCLSRVFDQTVMWSHYADKHKGVCLGFKRLGADGVNNVSAIRVKYCQKVKPLKFSIPPVSETNSIAFINMFFTKAKAWEYEKEVRIIDFRKNGLVQHELSNLVELYFGVNTTPEDVEKVLSAIKTTGYKLEKIAQMKTNRAKFELDSEIMKNI